ncbi:hypothetical protein ERO13_D02G097950v2 [Gossypium hirsutum]|uniref:Uncharacterized protein n=3 Tax=Gossypium TaxID=3633 RepID=A0A5J5SB36_GOSBA|nr:hypothetical protein ES319_D02G111900v1 [Gossypium barbadense]KAG4158037.1 hypothetical protein ERO13_D02G097950v2 [Gossypium hirsutum]TYG79170.1 hypothetical protein ES288_D02G119600v1 [Gossypium darwinii]TYH83332.1 hypothetical protein ES332_D02G125600v1 [Gossypium tomentosum]
MSAGLGKYTKIRHIVRLRQMLQRWRNKALMSARRIPSDVPVGHVAIYVGTSCRRFVVRVFRKLLIQAEEDLFLGIISKLDFTTESRPLLHGFAGKE